MSLFDLMLVDVSVLVHLIYLAVATSCLCGFGLLAAWLCQGSGATLRHGILLGALILAILSPLAHWLSHASGWRSMQIAIPSQIEAMVQSRLSLPVDGGTSANLGPRPVNPRHPGLTPTELGSEPPLLSLAESVSSSENNTPLFHSVTIPWWQLAGSVLACVWMFGICLGVLRLVRDYIAIYKFRRTLEETSDERLRCVTERAAKIVGLRGIPCRFTSPAVPAPLCLGLLQPAIVLPDRLELVFEEDQLFDILIHELAHVSRRDLWIAFAARIGTIVYWWNPLIYNIRDQLAALREDICDNFVCQSTGSGERFARTLVELATYANGGTQLPATIGILEQSGLVDRVTRLLNKDRTMATHMSWKSRFIVTIANLFALSIIVLGGSARLAHSQPIAKASGPTDEKGQSKSESTQKLVPLRGLPVPPSSGDIYTQVFIGDADGSNMKPLVDLGEYKMQGAPTWSSDGKLIALEAWRPEFGEANANSRIVVVDADGKEPRFLGDGGMPSFSPQGDRIAFTRYEPNQGVWVMSSEGPEKELILVAADGWSGRWSPDGKHIGYITYGDNPNLIIVDVAKGEVTSLFEKDKSPYRSFLWNFAWSPDGRQIAFKGQRVSDSRYEMGIIDARGAKHGLVTRYLGEVFNISWGPEQNQILMSTAAKSRSGRIQIHTLDPNTKDQPTLLAGQDPMRRNNLGVLSPNGKKLLTLSRRPIPSVTAGKTATTPRTVAQVEYDELLKTQRDAQAEFSRAYQAATSKEEKDKVVKELGRPSSPQSYSDSFSKFVQKYPNDPVALKALDWLVQRDPSSTATTQAISALGNELLESPKMAELCRILEVRPALSTERLLQTLILKSPHREVQGLASFAQCSQLKHQLDRPLLGNVASADTKVLGRIAEANSIKRKKLESMLEDVIAKFGDVQDFRGTLKQTAESMLFELQHLSVGSVAPEITGEDLAGQSLKLSDYRGKALLLVFWGTWCGPCMAAVPEHIELLKRMDNKPFAIVGVNSDKDRAAALKIGEEKGINWRSWWDAGSTKGPIATRWNIDGWPTLYLIDSKGVIRFKGDSLRAVSNRRNADGQTEQYRLVDDYVDQLMKELESPN